MAEYRQFQEEDKREQNFALNQYSVEKKRRNNQYIFSMNQVSCPKPEFLIITLSLCRQKTKQFIAMQEKQGYFKRLDEKQSDVERKRDKTVQIKQQQHQFLQYKALSQAQQQEEVRRNYVEKEMSRQQSINIVADKMRQLEGVEHYLVDQLGKTQNTQQKAMENLHSVVQLCN